MWISFSSYYFTCLLYPLIPIPNSLGSCFLFIHISYFILLIRYIPLRPNGVTSSPYIFNPLCSFNQFKLFKVLVLTEIYFILQQLNQGRTYLGGLLEVHVVSNSDPHVTLLFFVNSSFTLFRKIKCLFK